MKALIFGATGLIGTQLVKRILSENAEVTGVARGSNTKNISSKKYHHISLDISKKEEFSKVKGDFDIVFNMAAHIATGYGTEDALKCLLVNSIGTLNILEFMLKRGIKRLIHSSSVTVYGRPTGRVVYEKSPLNPIIVYGVSKLTAEKYCDMFANLHDLQITMLRYASVYGAGLTQRTALPIFIHRAQMNEDLFLYGNGARSQDYVYVDDVIEANMLAVKKGVTGVFNIGSGRKTTMKNLAETIIDVFESKSKIRYDPTKPQEFSLGIDIGKAQKELSYKPRYDLRSGLIEYRSSIK